MRMFNVLLSVFVLVQSAGAATPTREINAFQAAIDSRNEFVTALKNKDFTEVTHQGFDGAIRDLAEQIRVEQKDNAMADQLLARWEQSSSNFAGEIASMLAFRDLGDHAPLFPWLETFIKDLSDKYGSVILNLPAVKNIEMLNFAIPVVFAPHGSWQAEGVDNRVEYRKHFIPFANLITYYISFYGCKYALAHQGVTQGVKQICGKAADKLEFVMGRYIAPFVSDWIYRAGNQSLEIGADRLRYTTGEELGRAIQQ